MAQAQKVIRKIPAKLSLFSRAELTPINRRKVAAYARVSTDNEEQINSYDAQIDYYSKHIKSKPEWEFVNVYTDEGISATNTKHRDGFKQMVSDALSGKIDLIITKSVSRFARNTADSLTTIRKLKENDVECFFEKEQIWNFDGKGKLLLTIMSSLAQEESRSISQNTTWGKRKRSADGKINLPYSHFLGYEKGEDDVPKAVEKEAQVVKLIYKLFLKDKSPSAIAKILTKNKIKTPGGKEKWAVCTIKSILTNEKYAEDALLQKCFTVDFFTKKQKKNEGEIPQYFIENSHEVMAIIDKDIFEEVQNEFKARKAEELGHSSIHIFASKLICGDCGGFFGSKFWHSTDKYRRAIWQCNKKFKNKKKCQTPHLKEEQIKEVFVTAFNELMQDKSGVIAECKAILNEFYDIKILEEKLQKLIAQKNKIGNELYESAMKNATIVQSQEVYNQERGSKVEEFKKLEKKISELECQKAAQIVKQTQIEKFLKKISETNEFLIDFSEELWVLILKNIVINSSGEAVVTFRNEKKIVVEIPHEKKKLKS